MIASACVKKAVLRDLGESDEALPKLGVQGTLASPRLPCSRPLLHCYACMPMKPVHHRVG